MPESYQKTIGFPTYDLLAAVSLRMEGTDTTIDEARQQLDPENLHDSALDRYIYPRSGLERKAATFAHGSLTVTGTGTVFTQDYISYAQIGAAIMDTPGVIDYAGLKVSGGIVNIAIAERECPVLGEVTITYG